MEQTITNTKRQELKALSKIVKPAVKEGIYNSINEGLADLYYQDGHTELKSFNKWKESGYHVKKGEKALLLWGEKRKATGTPEVYKEPDEYEFFPVAYLFSNKQVEKKK